MDDHAGIAVEDLTQVYREGYLHAIEAARREHDPDIEWDAFCEQLWTALLRVFGVESATSPPRPQGSFPQEPTAITPVAPLPRDGSWPSRP